MSTPLADAFVRVRPDTKGFAQETEAQTAGLMGSFNKLGGVIAGVFAAETIVNWGKKSVNAFLSAQQAQHRLEDAFQRFPALADTNVKALEDLDSALGKKTEFDKYSIESGQAVLAQFHLTGTQLTTLTPLLLDYAAKTGQDVPQAATLLGKALLGNSRALKAIGIDFHNTGTTTGNYTELVGALRTQVGGFAEEEGKTAAGQLKIMENQFHDLAVQVGSVVVPTLSTLIGVVLDVTGAISGSIHWLEHNQAAAAALGTVIAAALIPRMIALTASAVEFVSVNFGAAVFVITNELRAMAAGALTADAAMLPLVAAVASLAIPVYFAVKAIQANNAAMKDGKQSADAYVQSLGIQGSSIISLESAASSLTGKLREMNPAYDATNQAANANVRVMGTTRTMTKEVTAAYNEYKAKLDEVQASVVRAESNEAALAGQFGLTIPQVDALASKYGIDLTGSLTDVTGAFRKQYAAVLATHHPLSAAQADFKKVSDKALSATDQVNALRDAFDLLVGKSLSADEASITFSNDLADLNAKLKASKGSMDLTTQAGRDAREQFDHTAQAALDLATSQKDAGFSTRTIKADLDKSIKSLEKTAGSNAHARAEVDKLKKAEAELLPHVQNVNTALSQVPNNPYAGVHIPGTGGVAGGGKFSAFGGLVTGPGTKTSDSVRMNLSAGEFVLDADTTERLGLPTLNALLSGGSLPASAPTVTALPVGGSDDKAAALLAEQNVLLRQQNALLAQQPAALAGALNGVAQSSAHQARGTVPVY